MLGHGTMVGETMIGLGPADEGHHEDKIREADDRELGDARVRNTGGS